MSRVLCLGLMMIFALQHADALSPEKCAQKPGPERCLTPSHYVHDTRYAYDAKAKVCFPIFWSDKCPVPYNENNFKDYTSCMRGCESITDK